MIGEGYISVHFFALEALTTFHLQIIQNLMIVEIPKSILKDFKVWKEMDSEESFISKVKNFTSVFTLQNNCRCDVKPLAKTGRSQLKPGCLSVYFSSLKP